MGGKKGNEQGNNQDELPDISTLTSFSKEDITDFVAKLSAADEQCDIENVPAKGLKQWLQLSRAPKSSKQKEFFCLFRTSHKNEIASRYSESDDGELSDNDETWITQFVSFLKHIKDFDWKNSFVDLPIDGNDEKGFFLLWLGNDTFEKAFYPSQERRTSTRNATNRTPV